MDNDHKPIGVLAIQGDFAMHAKMLERMGAPYKLVKHPSELAEVGGLIMPGGESTTMLKFFSNEGMGQAIKEFVTAGKPVFGTCAGAILLAKEVLNPPQERLGLLDITIERNAYGRQVDSSVRQGECPELSPRPLEMVFIRAPDHPPRGGRGAGAGALRWPPGTGRAGQHPCRNLPSGTD